MAPPAFSVTFGTYILIVSITASTALLSSVHIKLLLFPSLKFIPTLPKGASRYSKRTKERIPVQGQQNTIDCQTIC